MWNTPRPHQNTHTCKDRAQPAPAWPNGWIIKSACGYKDVSFRFVNIKHGKRLFHALLLNELRVSEGKTWLDAYKQYVEEVKRLFAAARPGRPGGVKVGWMGSQCSGKVLQLRCVWPRKGCGENTWVHYSTYSTVVVVLYLGNLGGRYFTYTSLH